MKGNWARSVGWVLATAAFACAKPEVQQAQGTGPGSAAAGAPGGANGGPQSAAPAGGGGGLVDAGALGNTDAGVPMFADAGQSGAPDDGGQSQPEGGGMRGLPDLCELARASTLLVRADITSVGSAENAGQAGLTTPSDTMTFFNDPTLSATPVTIQVVTVEYVSQGVVAPSTSLTFLFESDHGLVGPTGTPVTSGLFFLTQFDGQWVLLIDGCVALDPTTGKLWDENPNVGVDGLSEADLISQAETARSSTGPCYQARCTDDGVMHLDGGWCSWPDAGPTPSWDGGQPQPDAGPRRFRDGGQPDAG